MAIDRLVIREPSWPARIFAPAYPPSRQDVSNLEADLQAIVKEYKLLEEQKKRLEEQERSIQQKLDRLHDQYRSRKDKLEEMKRGRVDYEYAMSLAEKQRNQF